MLSLEDLPVPTVEKQVDIGRELVIPWIHRELTLGTGFSSKLISTPNPWITARSPFNIDELRKQRLLYDGKVEGRHNFRDAESTSHSTGMEHTSGSLGVAVGCSFLSASVTGSYDKTVLETKDTYSVSRTCLVRDGVIRFKAEPRLSYEAEKLLREPNGQAKFQEVYGDYYVSCYILGGDAGVYVATSDDTVDTRTKEKVTVKVKVLFFTASKTFEKEKSTHDETFQVTLSGYDTLTNTCHGYPSKKEGLDKVSQAQFNEVRRQSIGHLQNVDKLPFRVRERMRELRLVNDQDELEWSHCSDICQAGLVVQVILMPYRYLRDYQIALYRN
ncbi:hypothetical protein QWA68_010995 [Fusarium oxysporum]|nr:hypothetical protein QWA68_010995 [Fusarium oxysporum]